MGWCIIDEADLQKLRDIEKNNKNTSISKKQVIEQARILFSGTKEKENPEYLRGMCELIAYCFGEKEVDSAITADKIKKLILKNNK